MSVPENNVFYSLSFKGEKMSAGQMRVDLKKSPHPSPLPTCGERGFIKPLLSNP
jgi:hypothetical protein